MTPEELITRISKECLISGELRVAAALKLIEAYGRQKEIEAVMFVLNALQNFASSALEEITKR